MSNIKLKIDEQEYSAEQGQTILEVAEENGIEIPTMCHNGRISQTTSCFVCVVKNKETGQFMPSCSTRVDDGMEIEVESDDVFEMRQSALNLLLSEHIGDCEAPCTIACPAHAQVEEYIREGKNGNFTKALEIIKRKIPLPMSIGRVCPRFCEQDCRRNVVDEGQPVAINDFKRLAADKEFDNYLEDLPELQDSKVAVVGGGPAGISAAYYLRREGIRSDIYEKMPKAGGMLQYGIPKFRLPKHFVDKEIQHFDKMGGVDIFTNQELGKDIQLEQLKKDYDAVVLAVGSWKPGSMYAEGEELADGGIKWLENIARNDFSAENPGKTIVVGGGNTAMDCVRTAVRLGSDEVFCYYRRTEKQMPAEQIEIDEAKEEGVQFKFLSQPTKVRKENGQLIVTFKKMELGEKDASGRRRPIPIEGSEYDVKADTVIAAIGQKTIAPEGSKTNKWGDIEINEENGYMADNVFAAGDCVTGPATVVEAVAAGRNAALGIEAFLRGEEYEKPYEINVSRGHWQSLSKDDLVYLKELTDRKREKLEYIPLEKRKNSFEEITHTFTEEAIAREGERCLECSCTDKHDCKLKDYSEQYLAGPEAITGEKRVYEADTRHPDIIIDRNKCIKCGTCVKVCKEVVNESLLDFRERGFDTNITTAFGEQLPLSCADCGECIKECPVGALDWRDKERAR